MFHVYGYIYFGEYDYFAEYLSASNGWRCRRPRNCAGAVLDTRVADGDAEDFAED